MLYIFVTYVSSINSMPLNLTLFRLLTARFFNRMLLASSVWGLLVVVSNWFYRNNSKFAVYSMSNGRSEKGKRS